MQSYGGSARAPNGAMTRFKYEHAAPRGDRSLAALRPGHPALIDGHTIFPTRVSDPSTAKRILISGHNNAKIGAFVTKGPWAGLPIFTLTLEERATCPTSCHLWAECYGNAMPMPRRWRYGPELIDRLDSELRDKAREHPRGFVVRLHVLGDFPDMVYVDAWQRWMAQIPSLRVYGYTAHAVEGEIGKSIARTNSAFAGRWAVRFSVAPQTPHAPMQATTVWGDSDAGAQAVICPAGRGADTCGTCALCWSETASDKRIVFLGHGMNHRNSGRKPQQPSTAVVPFRAATIATDSPADFVATLDREISSLEQRLSAARALRAIYGSAP